MVTSKDVDEEALSCLFVNYSNVWFGDVYKAACLKVEITQDFDGFDHFLSPVVEPFLNHVNAIFPTSSPLKMKDLSYYYYLLSLRFT